MGPPLSIDKHKCQVTWSDSPYVRPTVLVSVRTAIAFYGVRHDDMQKQCNYWCDVKYGTEEHDNGSEDNTDDQTINDFGRSYAITFCFSPLVRIIHAKPEC